MSLAGLNICVLSPFGADAARGNATTAGRIADRLRRLGAQVDLRTADLGRPDQLEVPNVIIGVHAGHFANSLRDAEFTLWDQATKPAIVLMIGGNDLYEDLGTAPSKRVTGQTNAGPAELLRTADAVLVSSQHQLDAALSQRSDNVYLVPRSPIVGHAPIKVAGTDLGEVLTKLTPGKSIAWCGALRSQKRPEWIAPIMEQVRDRFPSTRLLIAGPAPDSREMRALDQTLLAMPHTLRLPMFSNDAVGTLLGHTDIALNTSRTEGMSNFLLESMSEGVPVVAANAAGTKTWIHDQALLFSEPEQAADQICALLDDENKRIKLGQRGCTWLAENASVEKEASALSAAVLAAIGRS